MTVRPLGPDEDHLVEAIFEATLALGRPLPFPLADLDRYRHLCLGWYLGPGREDVRVLEVDGAVVGYVLVCIDDRAHRGWCRRPAWDWTTRAVREIAAGRYPVESERFHRLRLRDGFSALAGPPPPCAGHLHLNIAAGHRQGSGARDLLAAAEGRLRRAGRDQWYGEVNARIGRRASALERLGGRVVDRRTNHTLSWLVGAPVERLRIVRRVPAYSQPLRRNARYISPATTAMPSSTIGYPNRQRSSGSVSKFIP